MRTPSPLTPNSGLQKTIQPKMERTLALRNNEHRGYVRNEKLDKATGEHFNLPGHNMSDIKITVLEKVKSDEKIPQCGI